MQCLGHMEKTWVKKNTFSLAVVILFVCIDAAAGASSSISGNKHVIETIKSEDGDIIDCVDILHQPAFDHPLLKNHTIQMWPSDYPKAKANKVSSEPLQQLWQKSGSCPQGTVPIRRTQMNDLITAVHAQIEISITRASAGAEVKYEGPYYGGSAVINVWNVPVESFLYSSASVFVNNNNNYINVGWILIYPQHYGDNKTRFYIYWTADGGEKTGCYDLVCSGFVHVDHRIALGATLSPLSTYDGPQYTITMKIYKERQAQNWWVLADDVPVGYWPSSLFKDLNSASKVQWVGQVADGQSGSSIRIITPMGSGHSPNSGYGRAAFFKNIAYLKAKGQSVAPGYLANFLATKPNCYYAGEFDDRNIPGHGYYFFYGGPQGVSSNC